MNIAYVYATGRIRRFSKVKEGKAASEFFYGGIELGAFGHSVAMYEIDGAVGSSFKEKAINRIINMAHDNGLLPMRVSGGLLMQAKTICPDLNRSDVVVATTTGNAFALGLLKALGYIRPPILAIHCGILNIKHNWLRKILTGYLLRKMKTIVFGEAEVKEIRNYFNVPDDLVVANQFGVDTGFWTNDNSEDGDYVLSVGNDGRRDYELLVRAADKIKLPFRLVTSKQIKEQIPENVELISGDWRSEIITDEKLRDLYRKSRMVVIPLVESMQPSGQSVCLQAMACGKPVILSRTKGLWSEKAMIDNDNVLFVKPGDQNCLADKIMGIYDDTKKRKMLSDRAQSTTRKNGDIITFAKNIESICKSLLSPKSIRDGR